MPERRHIVFRCNANAARSQVAEGLARATAPAGWTVSSAGTNPGRLKPLATTVMAEVGIDISAQESQALDEFLDQPFDLVVTVCSNAERICPAFPNAKRREHWPFDDPYYASGSEDEVTAEFRRVRDQIGEKIKEWLAAQPTQRV